MDPIVEIFRALIVLVIASFGVGVGSCLLTISIKSWINNREAG